MGLQLRLVAARKRHGHRQVDAAAHFGITQSSYARWELGETFPDPRHYARMADYLGGATIADVWAALHVPDRAYDPVVELALGIDALHDQLRHHGGMSETTSEPEAPAEPVNPEDGTDEDDDTKTDE